MLLDYHHILHAFRLASTTNTRLIFFYDAFSLAMNAFNYKFMPTNSSLALQQIQSALSHQRYYANRQNHNQKGLFFVDVYLTILVIKIGIINFFLGQNFPSSNCVNA
jgi:hypothetical protein